MYTCLKNKPPHVSERAVFVKFDSKYQFFENIKTEEWDLNIFLLNYWNEPFLGPVLTCFLEVSAHVSLKWLTAGLWRVVLTELEWKYNIFLNRNTDEWDVENLIFNYWNDLVLDLVETYFLEVGAYLCLKGATAVVRERRFLQNLTGNVTFFLNIKMEEYDRKLSLFFIV